jgi:hypothetical protein
MDTQESNQPTEEAEDKPDRREMLAQALEDSEGTQEQPQEIQDAKPAQTVQADPEAAAEPEEKPVWERPPSSWKRDYHEIWETADPKLKQYAYQREEEMRAGIEPLIPKAKFADEVKQIRQQARDAAENEKKISESLENQKESGSDIEKNMQNAAQSRQVAEQQELQDKDTQVEPVVQLQPHQVAAEVAQGE